MEVNWTDPSQHDNLVQRYIIEISEANGYFTVNKSVDRQNQYLVNSNFIPGHLFTVTITSVVFLNDVGKTVYIKSNVLYLVVGTFLLFITNNNAFFVFAFSLKSFCNTFTVFIIIIIILFFYYYRTIITWGDQHQWEYFPSRAPASDLGSS